MAAMTTGKAEMDMGPKIPSPCRAKTARTYAERLQEILRSLHSTLRGMTPPQRERSFRQLFSQQQRLRLETYIVSTKANAPKELVKVQATDKLPATAIRSPSQGAKRSQVPGLVVNPQRNGRYFRAQVAIGSLRLVSCSSRDMQSTLPFCRCLSLVKDRLEEVRDLPSNDFAETFVKVLHAALQTHGISADDAGLRLYISFRPSCSRRRVSRHYLVADEAELRMGLEHWQRMQCDDHWQHIFLEDCRGRPRQLKRARAVLEESERRREELMARQQQTLQRQAEKERRKALLQDLASRKPRRPELSRPERTVRRLLRRWTALESSLRRGANRPTRAAALL